MLTLVNILTAFFTFLVLYQIFLGATVVEGLKNQYKPYNMNNPNNALILAQQNAGNISFLKERLDKFDGVYKQVQDLSGNIQLLQTRVNGLVQAQQDYANQMTGGTAPEVTGTVDEGQEAPSSSSFVT